MTGPSKNTGAALGTPSQLASDRTVLRLEGVTKEYGPIRALGDVSLELREGEILSLCGHNGAGKSTLVRLLGGVTQPDQGRIVLAGEPVRLSNSRQSQASGIAVVDQELSIVDTLTVEENLVLGAIDEPLINRRVDVKGLLERVGLRIKNPRALASSLSLAERQLLEIARGLGRGSRILILDEPTATLTDHEIAQVFSAVRTVAAEGCSVVFVSHRLGEVLDLSHRVVVLRDGQLVADRPVDEIDREQLVDLMIGSEVRAVERGKAGRATEDHPILAVDELTVPGSLDRISFSLRVGEVIALAGQVGSGASTLLRAIAGLEPTARGELVLDGKVTRSRSPLQMARHGVAYVTNDRKQEGVFLEQSLQTNLLATRLPLLSRHGVLWPSKLKATARRLATEAQIDAARIGRPLIELSGGNQQKALIGRGLDHSRVRVLLLDEPTRGVDIAGRADIHRLIREAAADGLAVVFASTELDELLELPDEIITMRAGRIIARHAGDVPASVVLGDMTHAEGTAA